MGYSENRLQAFEENSFLVKTKGFQRADASICFLGFVDVSQARSGDEEITI